MKKAIAYGIAVLCTIILAQCVFMGLFETGNKSAFLPFSQDLQNVESVEIYKSLDQWHENHALWKTPEKNTASHLLSQILELPDKGMVFEPPTSFGLYVIRIIYRDGTMDLLWETSRMTITMDGSIAYGYHNFDGSLNQLIEEIMTHDSEYEDSNHFLRDLLPSKDIEHDSIDDWKNGK